MSETAAEKIAALIPSPEEIDRAAAALRGIVVETPLLELQELADELGLKSLHLKLESMQRTGSFKYRGAYWRCLQLSADERARGVVAFSSGNFAQALPAAAAQVGTTATIVMPIDAPEVKRQRATRFGATVVQTDHGDRPREFVAAERARQIAAEEGRVLLHPFDDPQMIAGNASLGVEIAEALRLRERPPPERVFCCAGGGGLISGLALGLARHAPGAKVVPVEPHGFDSTGQSLKSGVPTTLELSETSICDALQALRPGDAPFASLSSVGTDAPVTVTDDQVRAAMALAYDLRRVTLEPAGAAPLAGLIRNAGVVADKHVIVIASGGNIQPSDFARLVA